MIPFQSFTATTSTNDARQRRRLALGGLYLSMLMSSLDTSITHTALPTLMQALHASFRQAQWIVLAYLISLTGLAVLAGRAGDRLGRRRVLAAGLALFASSSALCALAEGVQQLVAARALQGAGAAVMMALTVAFVADIVPGPQRGRAMGLLATTSAIGTTLGPPLGGWLAGSFGWQAIFLINVPFGLLAIVLAWRFLPSDSAPSSAHAAEGMLALCRTKGVAGCLSMMVLVAAVVMAVLVVGPFYLTRTLGFDVMTTGWLMSVGPLVAAIAGFPAGRLVDRHGARRAVSVSLAGLACGCVLLALLPVGLLSYLLPVGLLTASYSLFQAANSTDLMAKVSPRGRGSAAGLLALARNLGLITGASLMGAVFASGWAGGASAASAATAAQVAAGMRTTFALGSVMMAGALLLARFTRSHAHTPEA